LAQTSTSLSLFYVFSYQQHNIGNKTIDINTSNYKTTQRKATNTNSDPTSFITSIYYMQNERGKDTDYDIKYVVQEELVASFIYLLL